MIKLPINDQRFAYTGGKLPLREIERFSMRKMHSATRTYEIGAIHTSGERAREAVSGSPVGNELIARSRSTLHITRVRQPGPANSSALAKAKASRLRINAPTL